MATPAKLAGHEHKFVTTTDRHCVFAALERVINAANLAHCAKANLDPSSRLGGGLCLLIFSCHMTKTKSTPGMEKMGCSTTSPTGKIVPDPGPELDPPCEEKVANPAFKPIVFFPAELRLTFQLRNTTRVCSSFPDAKYYCV